MNKIQFNMKNCFGISNLSLKIPFLNENSKQNNIAIIYAPNGTMKSSFQKALSLYSLNKKELIKDELNEDNTATISIQDEHDKTIPSETILSSNIDEGVNSEDRKAISKILANNKLKKDLDAITADLEELKKSLIKELCKISNSRDCETEFLQTFKEDSSDTFYICLEKLEKKHHQDRRMPLQF